MGINYGVECDCLKSEVEELNKKLKITEENIIITDRVGVEKRFNCSAVVDVIYRAVEIGKE